MGARIKVNVKYQKQHTVICPLLALGLYNFARDFGWAYKRRGLYPEGAHKRNEKKNVLK